MIVSRMNQLFKHSKIKLRCDLEKNVHPGSVANSLFVSSVYDVLYIVLLFLHCK